MLAIFGRIGSYFVPFSVVIGGLILISVICLFVFPKEP
jgi:hypothetical protein